MGLRNEKNKKSYLIKSSHGFLSHDITFFCCFAFHIDSQEKEVKSKLERWGVKINDRKYGLDITAQKKE